MIDYLVSDLVERSRQKLATAAPKSINDVRAAGEPLVSLGAEAQQRQLELKRFLNRNLYQHFHVQRMSHKAGQVIRTLFALFMEKPKLLPPDVQQRIGAADGSDPARARLIADYIAGMTDRFAIAEHRRITDPRDTSMA
jgi:dGTPase